ncbi:MAG: CotS family spore coat protein [Carboxydocellales bacterium]
MTSNKGRDPQQQAELKYLEDVILREYDLRAIKKIKGGPGTWKVTTDRGDRFLKHSKCTKEELEFVRKVLEHTANHGFRRVARFLVTKFGDHFILDKGNLFYLTDWIEGKECTLSRLPHLEEAVLTLAEFHQAARGFAGGEPVRQEWGSWIEVLAQKADRIQELAKVLEERKSVSQLEKLISVRASGIYAWASQALSLLEQGDFPELVERERKSGTICHRSYSASNIILSKRVGGAYIVDLDHCVHDVQVWDLARLMGRALPKYQWDITIAHQLVDWYSGVRKLDDLEQKALVVYLAFPHLLYPYLELSPSISNLGQEDKLAGKFQQEVLQDELRKKCLIKFAAERKLGLKLEI